MATSNRSTGEALLFLTDEQLRQGIEAMFFAYRGFTADPDRILDKHGYGRAHHRAIHFINCVPGTTVNNDVRFGENERSNSICTDRFSGTNLL